MKIKMRKEILFLAGFFLFTALFVGIVEADIATPVSSTSSAHVSIPGYISITVNNTVDFGQIVPNENGTALLTVTIGPETNVLVDIFGKGNSDNFVGTDDPINHEFPLNQMQWSVGGSTPTPYTTGFVMMCPGLFWSANNANNLCLINNKLYIPYGQVADSLYHIDLTIQAQQH